MKKKLILILLLVSALFCFSCCGEETFDNETFSANAVATVIETDSAFSDRDYDTSFDSESATYIDLSETSFVAITVEGTYVLSGELSEGQIVVDAGDDKVQIVLDNVYVTNSQTAGLYVISADKVFLTLVGDNVFDIAISDSYTSTLSDNVDSAIFAKDDLTINGDGSLTIYTENGNGITGKDEVTITSGTFYIYSDNHGIEANDTLAIADGYFEITTGGGSADAITALESSSSSASMWGGMSNNRFMMPGATSASSGDIEINAKGLKSDTTIYISGGTFVLDTYDDAIHSDCNVLIEGGYFSITTGDDAVHGELETVVLGGTIYIYACYEGLEAQRVTVTGGNIYICSLDDGINASKSDLYSDNNGISITISGGFVYIDSYNEGDGIDSNGDIYIYGGQIYITSTTETTDVSLDYENVGEIYGGTFVATGASSATTQQFSSASTQCAILLELSFPQDGEVILYDSEGNVMVSFSPTKEYEVVIISSPEIEVGESYTLVCGNVSQTITMTDTLYGSGSHTSTSSGIFGGTSGNVSGGISGIFGGGTTNRK